MRSLLLTTALPRRSHRRRGFLAPREGGWIARACEPSGSVLASHVQEDANAIRFPPCGAQYPSPCTGTAGARGVTRRDGGDDLGLRLVWRDGTPAEALRPGGESRHINAGASAPAPLPCASHPPNRPAIAGILDRCGRVTCGGQTSEPTKGARDAEITHELNRNPLILHARAGADTPAHPGGHPSGCRPGRTRAVREGEYANHNNRRVGRSR
jgi:hypothetical protein